MLLRVLHVSKMLTPHRSRPQQSHTRIRNAQSKSRIRECWHTEPQVRICALYLWWLCYEWTTWPKNACIIICMDEVRRVGRPTRQSKMVSCMLINFFVVGEKGKSSGNWNVTAVMITRGVNRVEHTYPPIYTYSHLQSIHFTTSDWQNNYHIYHVLQPQDIRDEFS